MALKGPRTGSYTNSVSSKYNFNRLPVADLVALQFPAASDQYFNYTSLLLSGDGTNGAQNNTFLDSSSNNFTITRNGNTTQGTFSPFSQTGWSVNFGTSDTTWTTTDIRPTADFTIEGWIYPTNTSETKIIVFGNESSNRIGFFLQSSTLQLGYDVFGGPGVQALGTPAATVNTWNHYAIVRSGSTVTGYINGVAGNAPKTLSGTLGNANLTKTEGNSQYISNMRYITGQALYTGTFTPATSPLTTTSVGSTGTGAASSITGTVRLLVCQDNRFKDNSSNNFSISAGATASVQAFSPFAPTAAYSAATVGGSRYFDGSGDYLTGNGVLVTTTTANTFSCEGWFYPTTFANLIWLVGDMDATGGTNNVAVDISTGGAVELYWWDGAAKRCTSTSVMSLNQWNYFAVVVNSGAISIYVNSTTAGQSGTTTLTNRSAASQNFSVGQYNNSTTPNGYISNLRWSTSARTISAIPVAPYTSDADTRLLLNFTNAGIVDSTAKNVLETVGNAQVSTTQSKFGGSSMYFDGTGDYLVTPFTQLFNMWQGDSTVECWAYFNSLANTPHIWTIGEASVYRVTLYVNSSVLRLYTRIDANAGDRITSATTLSTGRWYHVAVTKNSGTWTLWLDGISQGTSTTTVFPFGPAENLGVGFQHYDGISGDYLNGYIDDLRITRGYARYTANFTPPTTTFSLR